MRKNIIIAAIAAASAVLLTVSCAKQEQPGLSNEVKTFTAVIDQGITKTTIDDYKVKWVSGDEISINGAVYSATPDGTDATKAGFAYKSGTTPSSPYSAIYPASLYNAGSLEFPAVQTYEAGKFNAPMYAKSTTESLSFKNICGVICFGLKGTSKVKSIAITANEAICGAFTMTDATTVSLTGTGKTVTLDCGDGVQLGTESTKFYVYLPPQNYTAGMKIVITDTDGGTFTQSTTSEVIIYRNELYTLDWTPSFIPAGALAGKFTVNAEGKQIQFSKGNLVATIDAAGTPTAWKFAANQYDCLGKGGANETIGTAAGDVDLFGWSTAANNFGISTYTSSSDYSGDFVDWGKNIGDGSTWRTLSKDEWVYLFKTRTNASSLYKYEVTVCGKTNCVVIAPDGFTGTIETSYDATTWPAAEAAGLVCLPAAGYRGGSGVFDAVDYGYYWSSAAIGSIDAYYVYFSSSFVFPDSYDYRYYGSSVRLITDVEGSSPVEPEPVKEDPLSGKFTVNAEGKQIQFSKGNLVATIDAAGTPTAWKFAANQYDCLGEGGANKTIGTAAGDVDLFGWSTDANNYGISTSTSSSDYSGDFVDWGKNIGDGSTWRTLSKDEWVYLFETRTNASGLHECGVTVCGKTFCVVIAPDGFTGTIETSYDATAWATAEAAGLVCLPAAGFRYRSDVDNVDDVGDFGDSGYCWSSTADDGSYAYYVYFDSGLVFPDRFDSRNYGYSVRLITECK